MPSTDAVVIGAGHAGLAVSHCLTALDRSHVVLERGRTGERWRSERWDSLRLLTPNWMSRLPGWSYAGPEPDGYMTRADVVSYLASYAASFAAPLRTGTSVGSVELLPDGFRVTTDQETWRTDDVILATGANGVAAIPAMARSLPGDVHQLSPSRYRNPRRLPDGTVLVVGASSSGVQIADELRRAGRPVILAVGNHSRLPRRYRGSDIHLWLDRVGILDRSVDTVADLERARREPSLQLVGREPSQNLDLGILQHNGVRLTGRLTSIDGTSVGFADDLQATIEAAERRMRGVLGVIDAYVAAHSFGAGLPEDQLLPVVAPRRALRSLDLRREGITTVIWATGYRQEYPWLRVPVLTPAGGLRHDRGVTPTPGLYAVGLRFQSRRNSSFLDGARHDARFVTEHLVHRHRPSSGRRTQPVGSLT